MALGDDLAVAYGPANGMFIYHLENGEWIERSKLAPEVLDLGFPATLAVDGRVIIVGGWNQIAVLGLASAWGLIRKRKSTAAQTRSTQS